MQQRVLCLCFPHAGAGTEKNLGDISEAFWSCHSIDNYDFLFDPKCS